MIGGGLGGLLILVIALLLGGDPRQLLQLERQLTTQQAPAPDQSGGAIHDETIEFVSVVLKDTEDVWTTLLAQSGQTYRKPHLTLFSGQVESACGLAGAAVGPFYCAEDERVYLDAEFFGDLERLGGPGDFARAYVIAHEVGHHVQNLLGVTEQVHRMRGQVSEEEYNALSVRLELQADFYAGVWAHHVEARKHILEAGDINEALQAAAAIGDDRLQKRSQGFVVPESFTHGTSEQRERWFRRGFETGDPRQGDTFNARAL
jgi:predicted metalloprotease